MVFSDICSTVSQKVSPYLLAFTVAATSLGLEGCVTTGSTFQNVIPTATRAGTRPFRQGMASVFSHDVKCALGTVSSCGQNNGLTTDSLGTQRRPDPRLGY